MGKSFAKIRAERGSQAAPRGVRPSELKVPPRKNTLHNRLIQALVDKHGVLPVRFRRTVIETCGADYWLEDPGMCSLQPDGFTIADHRADQEWFAWKVTAYEVEHNHPVDHDRLELYRELFWILDQDYIALELVLVDRFAQHRRLRWQVLAGYQRLDETDAEYDARYYAGLGCKHPTLRSASPDGECPICFEADADRIRLPEFEDSP